MPAFPKPTKPTAEEIEHIKSDVSSFASSLGLCLPLSSTSGGGGGGGFDDSDFRKSGPLKPSDIDNQSTFDNGEKGKNSEKNSRTKPKAKAKAKPHPLQINPFHEFDEKRSNDPKLPLMKATSLSGHWYVDAEELERRLLGDEGKKLPVMGIEELKDLAAKKKELSERLLGQYTREYEATRKKSGDMRLLETTARSGTSVDKISAFTCLVEDNPIASMRALDALLSMVTSKVGKRFAFNGYEALKELFVLRLLPNRKLKCLIQRPLHILPENKDGYSLLLFWYWEECLKQRYERFVISLEEAVMDVLPSLKDRAMKTVYALLKSKPEQERRLLCSLVNKLGDPEKKAASNAGYQLSCLLSEHPYMKATVINDVDSFLFRPHIGLRAKYYAVNFLCQVHLSKRGDGPKIAKRLVELYFALFKVLIFESGNGNMHDNKLSDEGTGKSGRKGRNFKRKPVSSLGSNKTAFQETTHVEMDSRILSALLTGVNRAFPFVSSVEADDILEVQTPILYKLAHSENFNVGVQALMLLYQITAKNQIASDRFYRALYAKLLTPAAVSSSKPEMFLGLLVRAMKNDINMRRVSAFSKRLMQVALQRPPQYACGCLFLLSEVLKAKPPLWRVILQDSIDDELEHFEDILEEEQNMPPEKNATLHSSVAQKGKISQQDSDSDKENNLKNGPNARSANDRAAEEAQSHPKGSSLPGGYDPRHREPVYCNADRTGLWELTILASHVHPSVAAMAKTLLSGENIVYNGDPLNDLSLGAFLDKLMEKKPRPNKKAEGIWHGGSQIAPTKKLDTGHHLIGEEILQLAEEEVPPEDVVFHRFYMNKTSSSKKLKKKKAASADDEDEGADLLFDENEEEDGEEEEEEEIDNMLGTGPLPLGEEEGEFDYGDLSRVIEEDDEDLLGHGSDAEDEQTSDAAVDDNDVEEEENGDASDIEVWGADTYGDNGDDNDNGNKNPTSNVRKKMKSAKKNRPSPFASLEDFEHLMAADDTNEKMAEISGKKYKSKLDKKRKRTRYV